MAQRSAPNKWLCYLIYLNSGHNTRMTASFLDRIRECNTIDNSCHHSHIISTCTINSFCCSTHTTEDIPSSDDDHKLVTRMCDTSNFCREVMEKIHIDTTILPTLQCFTREFEEESFDLHREKNR